LKLSYTDTPFSESLPSVFFYVALQKTMKS